MSEPKFVCEDCRTETSHPGYCTFCLLEHREASAIASGKGSQMPQERSSALTAEEWVRDYRRITLTMLESVRTLTWEDYRKTSQHRTEVRLALLRGEENVDMEALNPEFYGGWA